MSTPEPPSILLIEATADHGDAAIAYADVAWELASAHGGRTLIAAPASRADVLEAGSPAHAVVAIAFPGRAALDRFWSSPEHRAAFADRLDGRLAHALALPGIPEAGLPDQPIPTRANVTVPDSAGPPAYMLIQGTVRDPGPIEAYMAIIVPMIIARGGLYLVWTPPEPVSVLAGDWAPQFVVLSRWPSIAEPRDFWYSDRYQNEAIPTRRDAAAFTVLLFEGQA